MKLENNQINMLIGVKIDFGMTLWQAIKLRIAGKAYHPIAEEIKRQIVSTFEESRKEAFHEPDMDDR